MTRDAFENHVDPATGELVFDNLPRLPGGGVDWSKLGGVPPEYRKRGPGGRRRTIATRGTVPGPDGDPTPPE